MFNSVRPAASGYGLRPAAKYEPNQPAANYEPALKVLKQYSNHTVLLLQLFKNIGRLKPQSLADATPMPMDYVAILTDTDYSSYN